MGAKFGASKATGIGLYDRAVRAPTKKGVEIFEWSKTLCKESTWRSMMILNCIIVLQAIVPDDYLTRCRMSYGCSAPESHTLCRTAKNERDCLADAEISF